MGITVRRCGGNRSRRGIVRGRAQRLRQVTARRRSPAREKTARERAVIYVYTLGVNGYIKSMGENFLSLSRSKNRLWTCRVRCIYTHMFFFYFCANRHVYSLQYQETTKSAYTLH